MFNEVELDLLKQISKRRDNFIGDCGDMGDIVDVGEVGNTTPAQVHIQTSSPGNQNQEIKIEAKRSVVDSRGNDLTPRKPVIMTDISSVLIFFINSKIDTATTSDRKYGPYQLE